MTRVPDNYSRRHPQVSISSQMAVACGTLLCPPSNFFVTYWCDVALLQCAASITTHGLIVIIGVPAGLVALCIVACVICVVCKSSAKAPEVVYINQHPQDGYQTLAGGARYQ